MKPSINVCPWLAMIELELQIKKSAKFRTSFEENPRNVGAPYAVKFVES
jgi:hypothetical protein